jgi:hypothetical protein
MKTSLTPKMKNMEEAKSIIDEILLIECDSRLETLMRFSPVN